MTAPTAVLSIRPRGPGPNVLRIPGRVRQDVGGWSETTWRGLSGVLKKSFSRYFRWLTASPGRAVGS